MDLPSSRSGPSAGFGEGSVRNSAQLAFQVSFSHPAEAPAPAILHSRETVGGVARLIGKRLTKSDRIIRRLRPSAVSVQIPLGIPLS